MATTLTGNEVFQITGVDGLGRPSGTTETVSALQMATYTQSGVVTTDYLPWAPFVAAGSSQTGATPVNTVLNLIAVAPANSGVILPLPFNAAGTAALQMFLINAGANNVNIYPAVGMSINSLAVNSPYVLPPGLASEVIGLTPTSWSVAITNIPPGFVYNTNTAIGNTTLPANALTGPFGFQDVTLAMTGAMTGAGTVTLASAASTVASIANPVLGQTWRFRFINESGNNQTWTIAASAGWSTGGTLTVAQNTWRDFYASVTSVSGGSMGLQGIGTGTYS